MKLHVETSGAGTPLVILHGIFGGNDNWTAASREFSKKFLVHAVDLRNHGLSPHHPTMSYDAMVEDVVEFVRDQQYSHIILLGHSMGGRVAMMMASQYPDLVKKLVVVDVAPKPYNSAAFKKYSEAMKSVDLASLQSRKDADRILEPLIPENNIRLFLLKSLKTDESKRWYWQFNLEALSQWIKSEDHLHIEEPFWGDALFVKGEKSDYILQGDEQLILEKFPHAIIETISGAGHWPHIDKPQEFLKIVDDFLKS